MRVPVRPRCLPLQAPTFGIRDSRSIKEQRESLPIYLLKDALVKAIAEHQMVVVIGETGSGAVALELHCLQAATRSCLQPASCKVAEPSCSISCTTCKVLPLTPLQNACSRCESALPAGDICTTSNVS